VANETLFASVADQRVAAVLSREVLSLLAARGSLPSHPALMFAGDVSRSGSGTISIPQVGLGGYDLLSSIADGSAVGNTVITDAVTTLTPARYSKSYEPSDLAKWTDALGILDPMAMAQDAVQSWNATMLYLLAQMGSGFSATPVGTSGADMSVANLLAGRIALEVANVQGPYLAILHGQQHGDLTVSAATATGGAIQWRPETQTQIGGFASPNDKGSFLGVDIWATNHVPSANAGADRAGFVFGRGAIVWGTASVQPESADQMALGPYILFERDRTAKEGLTAYITHAYMAFSEAIDAAGIGIVTDL
jgi:hypothetical protein